MSDNKAVVKIIAEHTRETNELNAKYLVLGKKFKTLMQVHVEVVNKCSATEEQNHDLRELLKETQKECRTLQYSLDQCQRDLEELIDK